MANLAKIKENAGRIIDFLDVCNIYSGNVPPEVYLKFNISDRPDKDQSFIEILFCSAFETIAEENPYGKVFAWFLSGLTEYYSEPGETPQNLLPGIFSDVLERFDATRLQLREDLSKIYDNPQAHLNDTYNIPWGDKKTITVSELDDYDLPTKESSVVTDCAVLFSKGLKKYLAMQLMPSQYEIATIYYYYHERPDPFEPEEYCYPQNPESGESNSPIDWDGNRLMITTCGSSGYRFYVDNQDGNGSFFESSFIKTVGKILKDNPAGFYCVDNYTLGSPWPPPAPLRSLKFYSYWLIQKGGYLKEDFSLAPADFCNWIFSDDGFGNIVNPNGVDKRENVFTQWGLNGSKGVYYNPNLVNKVLSIKNAHFARQTSKRFKKALIKKK